MRTARIIVGLVALFVVLFITLGFFVFTIGCATSTPEQRIEEDRFNAPLHEHTKLLIPARNRLVAPVEPQALETGKQALQVEPQFAVFDGVLCEMVRGQWRPKPPGTPWGTHTVCETTDSRGNVTVRDVFQEAK